MFKKYRENHRILKIELEKIAEEFEKKSYEELLRPAEELSTERIIDSHKIIFSAEHYNVKKNGDICFCIDADGLPTLFGIKPSWQFFKRKDGTVYY